MEGTQEITWAVVVSGAITLLGTIITAIIQGRREERKRRWEVEDRRAVAAEHAAALETARLAIEQTKAETALLAARAEEAGKQAAAVAARSAKVVVDQIKESRKDRKEEQQEVLAAVQAAEAKSEQALQVSNNHNKKHAEAVELAKQALEVAKTGVETAKLQAGATQNVETLSQ